MSMKVSTRIKGRIFAALLLAIFCSGCDQSSSSSVEEPGDDADWPENSTRVEETDMDTVFSEGWAHANSSHDWSGGKAAVSSDQEASMSFNFTGNQIRWIGWRESGAGIARVYLDGKRVKVVDLYSNTIAVQKPVFTSEVLEQGPHTLTIEVDGTANPRSSGSMVVVDAFEIVSDEDIRRPRVRRIEETDSSLSFTGEWQHGDTGCACSAHTKAYTSGPDTLVSFSFTGTRVRWISYRKPAGGIANVYLDGAFVGEVDLFSSTVSSQAPVFTSEVLAHGPHTLLIEATGSTNPAATANFVTVDAFDVAGEMP